MKQVLERSLAFTGEAIDPKLAVEMVNDYQKAFPGNVPSFVIGKDILQKLMAQKGCRGIRFYNAAERGSNPTLVYVAVNKKGNLLESRSVIGDDGEIKQLLPIVADRSRPGTRPGADELEWGLPE